MKKDKIEVRYLGVTIGITRESASRFVIADYSSGKRVRHVRTDEHSAREKAREVCEMLAKGKQQERALIANDELKYEVRRSLEVLEPTGKRLLPAATLFAQAVSILGNTDELLRACEFWRQNRPNRPVKPKRAAAAVREFLVAKNSVSARRRRNLACYLRQFETQLGAKMLDEVRSADIEALIEEKGWSPKTHNEFLGAVGLLFKFAQSGNRDWVPAGFNPVKAVERRVVRGSDILIFEPWEVRQMLDRVEPELIPFLALWNFSGCRKEELSRITWQQINTALKTNKIELLASQTKTGYARTVPLLENAKSWLIWWLSKHGPKGSGLILPARWNSLTGLDDLSKFIARNAGIVWKRNGCRHSYISYRSQILGNTVLVADECGNSPHKIEKHYRAKFVMLETAKAWFNVVPPTDENIIPMPQSDAAVESVTASPITADTVASIVKP